MKRGGEVAGVCVWGGVEASVLAEVGMFHVTIFLFLRGFRWEAQCLGSDCSSYSGDRCSDDCSDS